MGDDVRNGIYLPNYGSNDNPTIWIDYFTGEQYRGGQVINNFKAPLWKLPLFVQAGAIVPMYEENNNPQAISETNKKGLDKTRRIVEFWPAGDSEYTLFEDDGKTINSNQKNVEGYGVVENVDYGTHVSTKITSKVKWRHGHPDHRRVHRFVHRLRCESLHDGCRERFQGAFCDHLWRQGCEAGQRARRLSTRQRRIGAGAEAVWYYEKAPDLNHYRTRTKALARLRSRLRPKVYVFLPKTDVSKAEQVLVVKGFANSAELGKDVENPNLAPAKLVSKEEDKTPASIKLTWEKVAGATGYELMVDGCFELRRRCIRVHPHRP